MHVCVPINAQCVHVMHVSVCICVREHVCVCPSVCALGLCVSICVYMCVHVMHMSVSICVYRDGCVYPSVCVRLCDEGE